MLSPICACLQQFRRMRHSSCSSLRATLALNFTSKYYLPTYRIPCIPDCVCCNSYRFYSNKPVVRKEGETLPKKPPKNIFENEPKKKMHYLEYFAKTYLRAPAKRGMEKKKMLKGASYVYEQLSDEVNVMEFFKEFDLPDTFASWFVVMELHVYLVAARVFKREAIGIEMRDMITDAFWVDVQYRAGQLGSASLMHRRKQLGTLGYQFQAAFYGYDEGVQSNDKVLAAMVWRRFFARECTDAEKIERLVKYIRVQLDYLNGLSFDDIVFNQQVLTIPLSEVQVGYDR